MKLTYTVLSILLMLALIGCTVLARRSPRPSRGAVARLDATLLLPIIGNLIIILSDVRLATLIGHYVYLLGIDLVLMALVNFTNFYCSGLGNGSQKPTIMYIGISVDMFQLLLNPFLGHAFSVETVDSDGEKTFRLVAYSGQTLHRIIDYAVLLCVILIFTLASVLTQRIHRERFTVLLGSMLAIGAL